MEIEPAAKLEAELLARIAAGDKQAFAELYDRQAPVLYSLALRVVNDPKDAEDVLQEAFLLIWDKAASYDPTVGHPLSWTVTLTRNKALDRVRATQRRSKAVARLTDELSDTCTASAESGHAAAEVANRERAGAVRAALTGLPAEQRHAIELAFFSGLTQTEIADTLGVPLGTVKARIRRGMLKLRDELAAWL